MSKLIIWRPWKISTLNFALIYYPNIFVQCFFFLLAPITNGSDAQVQENAEGKAELAKVKEAFSTLQSEQEDLLMMLSEQDVKLRGYKKIIKGLGQSISDDDDDLDLELSDWIF